MVGGFSRKGEWVCVEKVKEETKREEPIPQESLQKKQKKVEVELEDIFVALADLIIDSFLESRKAGKMVYLDRTQHKRKSL